MENRPAKGTVTKNWETLNRLCHNVCIEYPGHEARRGVTSTCASNNCCVWYVDDADKQFAVVVWVLQTTFQWRFSFFHFVVSFMLLRRHPASCFIAKRQPHIECEYVCVIGKVQSRRRLKLRPVCRASKWDGSKDSGVSKAPAHFYWGHDERLNRSLAALFTRWRPLNVKNILSARYRISNGNNVPDLTSWWPYVMPSISMAVQISRPAH